MASAAFNEFKFNILDAKRLQQAHDLMSNGDKGRKGLGHITRSGVVMLCAAWERYNEAVIIESVKHLASQISDPQTLPKDVRLYLSEIARNSKHNLMPMMLAGEGWRSMFITQAENETYSLNTPKSSNLIPLYKKLIGIKDVTTLWTGGAIPIDRIVSVRGDIAHKGRNAPYIKAIQLESYIYLVRTLTAEHDNKLCDYLKQINSSNYQPWRRTAR